MNDFKFSPGPWYYGISYEPEKGPVPFDYNPHAYFENSAIMAADGETVAGCGEYHIFSKVEDIKLMICSPELIELALQYRDDLRFTPSEESKGRRLERINEVLRKAGVL